MAVNTQMNYSRNNGSYCLTDQGHWNGGKQRGCKIAGYMVA
jgi:hypothetical protein